MISIIKSICLQGLNGILIDVEVDVSSGMPCWEIVGLADTNIKESKERVRTAIKNCDISLLSRKYIINLSPANVSKGGAILDVAIAIGVLKSIGVIKNINLNETAFIGELSLDGKINGVKGILPICLEAKKLGIKKIVIPKNNETEASLASNIDVIGVDNLKQLIEYLNGYRNILPVEKTNKIEKQIKYDIDFSEVKGQNMSKRALEISASGGHSCLLVGAPGTGKTMMIKRIKTILPKLTLEEAIEVMKIYSIEGNIINRVINERPFRNPHHSITKTSLLGGGKIPKPGEISLAHRGVLYLDELLEFKRDVLESLRVPLEDNEINISRLSTVSTFPCSFILLASMNPCPCGYYGSKIKNCICTEMQRKKYISKLSGPLLDRFDIQVFVPHIRYEDYNVKTIEKSEDIKKRVERAREIQINRYKDEKISTNSELTPILINKYCKLNQECENILNNSYGKLRLSTRGYYKIIKLSRTIADIEGSERINKFHIMEAIQYRKKGEK